MNWIKMLFCCFFTSFLKKKNFEFFSSIHNIFFPQKKLGTLSFEEVEAFRNSIHKTIKE